MDEQTIGFCAACSAAVVIIWFFMLGWRLAGLLKPKGEDAKRIPGIEDGGPPHDDA